MYKSKKQKMTLEELKDSGRIFYDVLAGSHAYGTSTPDSDEDLRGFYLNKPSSYVTLPEYMPDP